MVSAFLPPLDAEGQSMRERAGERRRIRLLIVAAYASVRAGLHSLLADAADITIIGEVLSGDDLERLMYGFSVLHCLPVGMADAPSRGTGTVMRPDTLRRYAAEAGFREVEIRPWLAYDGLSGPTKWLRLVREV